ncbi:MAG: restriction endonuclease subunit S [bacterium]
MADQTSTIPKGWKMTTLGKVAEITSSKRIFAEEYKTFGIPFFRGKEITEKYNGHNISTELFISEEKYNDIKNNFGVPEENDILLTSVGTLGNPYLVERDLKFYFKDGNLTWFRNYKDLLPKFLFYWIVSPQGKEILSYAKIGSTQEAYTITKLKGLSLTIPELSEQRVIAAVLSSLDSKVELLREQNKTLEAIAQVIFKEWFVNFNFPGATRKMIDLELSQIPEGWIVGKLGDEIQTILGGTPNTEKKEYWEDGTVPWINSGKVNDFRIYEPSAYITKKALEESAAKLMPKGTVVIAITGATLGQISRLEIESAGNQSVIGLLPNEKFSSSYLYYWMVENVSNIINTATGGAQQHINKNDVNNFDFLIPTKSVLEKYFMLADPIMEKISGNCFQIQTLSALRDTLLPKLMKGEVRVKGFNN